MRRKRAAVAGFLASLGERQLIDAAPHHDLERGLPDSGFCFAPALSVRAAYLGSPAPGSRHSSLSSERHFAGCAPAPAAASYQL
jgi:hypothetical protein